MWIWIIGCVALDAFIAGVFVASWRAERLRLDEKTALLRRDEMGERVAQMERIGEKVRAGARARFAYSARQVRESRLDRDVREAIEAAER